MNRFKFSNIHFLELKRNSAICAFISLSHFVTSGKKYLEEQVVKKKVIVFASKIKNKTKLRKTTTIITKKKGQLQPYQKLRNISGSGLKTEERHYS